MKKTIHPIWHNMKVFCEGKIIFESFGPNKELHVDIWSGNHPLYTKTKKNLDTEGRVKDFERKYNRALTK